MLQFIVSFKSRQLWSKVLSHEDIKDLREFIKYLASTRGMNLKSLVAKLHEDYGRKPSVPNFSMKVKKNTLSIGELSEVGAILNYNFFNIKNIDED